MPDHTMLSAVDTYAAQAHPSTNYAASRRLLLSGVASAASYVYIYFSRTVPLNAIVTSAKLRVFYDGAWGTATTVTAQRLGASLVASRLTWNNRPATVGNNSPAAAAPAGPGGTMVEVDVTAIMQTVANGAAWYGLRLVVPAAAAARWITSAEGFSPNRPQLYVAWSEAPHAPTGLGPNGNDAVSMAKPTLRFDVLDTLGDTTIAAVNVQTNATNSFTAPAFDSGWVVTGDPELDLSTLTAPAFPGLAEAQSIYWRVRVKDGAGLISSWSDVAQLRRISHGTLVILNPAPGSPAFVNEPTPPIVWDFTGHTQVQWKVTVARQSVSRTNPQSAVSSGKVTSTEEQWTVPTGFIDNLGEPFQLQVSVWDEVDRDPYDAYVTSVMDFVLAEDATTVPVTGLTAAQPDPWPSVKLTWQRATAPDSWVIYRNGTIIDAEVLPEDSAVSGTTYQFYDATARSWKTREWKVAAKVNNKISKTDLAKVTFTPKSRGIWIHSKSRGLRVWLAGADDGTWEEPEDATTLAPLQASRAVRLVQGVRNYEGSLGGQLLDAYNVTAATYETNLRTLRDHPTEPVTLSVADFTLTVILGNVQFAPTRHIPPSRLVTFDFWEV